MRVSASRPLALAALLMAASACGQSDAQSTAPPKDAAKAPPGAIKPLPINVAKAEAREVQRSVETVGSLLAWDDAQVRTEQPGTIARLAADLGDSVTRGQVLAEYDAREFQLAVKQAEADLLSSQQSLAPRAGHRGGQRGGAPADEGQPGLARRRGEAHRVRGGVGEVRARPERHPPPRGADRRARRRQCAQPPQRRAVAPRRGRLHPRPAPGPDADGGGAARLRPRRPPGGRGRGRAPRGDARDRREAARRHHDPRPLRRGDRQAPREPRRVRQGQHPRLQPGGARPAQVRGHGAGALRPRPQDGPARRADRGGVPRPELRGPGHAGVPRRRGPDPQPRPRGPRRQCRRPAASRVLRQGPGADPEGRLGGVRARGGRRLLRGNHQGLRGDRRPRSRSVWCGAEPARGRGWRSPRE